MPHSVTVPQFGQTVVEATVVRWNKQEGDIVVKGDILFEIETDKAVLEVESFFEGTLLKVLVAEGETVPVQTIAGFIGTPGEEIPDVPKPELIAKSASAENAAPAKKKAAKPAPVAAPVRSNRFAISPRAKKLARDSAIDAKRIAGTGPGGRVVERDVTAYLEKENYGQLRISPSAKALACAKSVNILDVEGTGPDGKIVTADVRAVYLRQRQMASRAYKAALASGAVYPVIQPVETVAPAATLPSMRPKAGADLLQTCNIVYAESHGAGLTMDCFMPRDGGNGLALIYVVSERWRSSRETLNLYLGMGFFDVLCSQGFTVFALCTGSSHLFTAADMAKHVHAGIRYIKAHAADYAIDPTRLGITGCSAGGHIGSLAALDPQPAERGGEATDLRAAGFFFPPADLVALGAARFQADAPEEEAFPGNLLFRGGLDGQSEDAIQARLAELSPALRIPEKPLPYMLIHGTADPVVPPQQSKDFAAALRAAGGEAELLIKEGGIHPWPDMRPEIAQLGTWFQEKLGELARIQRTLEDNPSWKSLILL